MGVPTKTKKINNTTSLIEVNSKKRHGKIVHQPDNLPREMLVEILARVASSSFTTLFNAKLSSKDLMEAAQDDYIYQRISINKFPVIHWFPPKEDVVSFLTRCFEKGNPEALFRRGMINYFRRANVESGLELLKSAVAKGHFEATYVYGMILLARGNQSNQQGLNLLNSMKSSTRGWKVQDSRAKIESIVNQIMRIKNPVSLHKVNTECEERDHASHFRRPGWSLDENETMHVFDSVLYASI
ncbi:putative F-box protein At1g67623 [Rutidosis leptorrhynchoides]|uniref:putative F-box protein At1g67623 n=1 Tax=Rutidosis leptorrhynchoides TaxID=125765 RepID=UPI003A9A478A